MVDTSLVQGLMNAISQGETLQSAMMSFFNAGYSKQDIEEAAREIQQIQSGKIAQEKQPVEQKVEKVVEKIEKSIPAAQPVVKELKPEQIETKISQQKVIQEVSSYGEEKPKKKGIPLWIILILIGVLFVSIIVLWFVVFSK